jgi:hypothetical protein
MNCWCYLHYRYVLDQFLIENQNKIHQSNKLEVIHTTLRVRDTASLIVYPIEAGSPSVLRKSRSATLSGLEPTYDKDRI